MRRLFFPLLVSMAMSCAVCDARAGDLRPASLKAGSRYSAERRGLSFLVRQDGRVTYESYANGDSADRIASIYSGTKGFWCVAAAAGVQDGILIFDKPGRKTITEGRSAPNKTET